MSIVFRIYFALAIAYISLSLQNLRFYNLHPLHPPWLPLLFKKMRDPPTISLIGERQKIPLDLVGAGPKCSGRNFLLPLERSPKLLTISSSTVCSAWILGCPPLRPGLPGCLSRRKRFEGFQEVGCMFAGKTDLDWVNQFGIGPTTDCSVTRVTLLDCVT